MTEHRPNITIQTYSDRVSELLPLMSGERGGIDYKATNTGIRIERRRRRGRAGWSWSAHEVDRWKAGETVLASGWNRSRRLAIRDADAALAAHRPVLGHLG